MAIEIVTLNQDESPPTGEDTILVTVSIAREYTMIVSTQDEMTVIACPLDAEGHEHSIECAEAWAGPRGIFKIYVKWLEA